MNLFLLAWLRLVHRHVTIKFIAKNLRSTREVDVGIKRESLNNFILPGNWSKHLELDMLE